MKDEINVRSLADDVTYIHQVEDKGSEFNSIFRRPTWMMKCDDEQTDGRQDLKM